MTMPFLGHRQIISGSVMLLCFLFVSLFITPQTLYSKTNSNVSILATTHKTTPEREKKTGGKETSCKILLYCCIAFDEKKANSP